MLNVDIATHISVLVALVVFITIVIIGCVKSKGDTK